MQTIKTSDIKAPKVSVLTPIYNTNPQHLRECIESILNQTFTDFEFIILNDSPDNIEIQQIVKSYPDARIRYYRNEKNMGISASRNKLLELAQGEYVAIFDHDDISMPKRLEKEVAYLDANPHVGVVYGKVRLLDWKRGYHVFRKFPQYDHEIRCSLTMGCYCVHTATMLRKSILVDNGIRYEEFFSPCEDYQLFNRLLDKTHFYCIQEVLVLYRNHAGNTTSLQKAKMRRISKAIRLDIQNRYPAYFYRYQNFRLKLYLFGFFPFIKAKRGWIYLFGFIPIFKVKDKV